MININESNDDTCHVENKIEIVKNNRKILRKNKGKQITQLLKPKNLKFI